MGISFVVEIRRVDSTVSTEKPFKDKADATLIRDTSDLVHVKKFPAAKRRSKPARSFK